MNKNIREFLKIILYEGHMWLNVLKNTFRKKETNPKYLFILCPPFSGSTLLNELLSSSVSVSCNNNVSITTREGQIIPRVKKYMWKDRWSSKKDLPWTYIKKIWVRHWDCSKSILLEKSPPDLMYVDEISSHFQPAYFICLLRNPYAFCESHMRRIGMTPTEAAQFWVKTAKYQKKNILNKDIKQLNFRYEDLVADKEDIKDKLINFLPDLKDINIDKEFSPHNEAKKPSKIVDMNAKKLAKITDKALVEINKVLHDEMDLMKFFNYSYYKR